MFWKKSRGMIRNQEQMELMDHLERSRQEWRELQQLSIYDEFAAEQAISLLLAEVRYRFLLSQARQRQWKNEWFIHSWEG